MNQWSSNDEAQFIGKFISHCYSIDATIPVDDEEFADVTDDTPLVLGKLFLRQKLIDYDLRQSVAEFLRCFASGSTA